MLRAVAIAACVIAAGWAALEVARYEGARAAWAAERDRIGSDAYDAARSDATYVEVEARRAGAEAAGWALAGAVVALGALAGSRGLRYEGAVDGPPAGRLLAASVLDVASLGGALALAVWLASLPSSLALAGVLARVLPAVALAVPLATLARGGTPGMRAVGARAAPSPLRACLALALLPLTALWLAVALLPLAALWLAGRAPRAVWLAPHLEIAGLTRSRDALARV